MNKISILIADDHAIFRDGLRVLLNAAPDIDVVDEAGNGQEAVTKAAARQPDVILMDINMPSLNGIEAARAITRANPQTGVIMLTTLISSKFKLSKPNYQLTKCKARSASANTTRSFPITAAEA
jgi:DNA-binding NarL/FixJ family response regulator